MRHTVYNYVQCGFLLTRAVCPSQLIAVTVTDSVGVFTVDKSNCPENGSPEWCKVSTFIQNLNIVFCGTQV